MRRVTAVMPTANRPEYVPRAIRCFQEQDYPNKELLIVDSGVSIAKLLPDDPRIRYLLVGAGRRIGGLRNVCGELARGEILIHWDDDDWSAPNRITEQVKDLHDWYTVTAFSDQLFWHRDIKRPFTWEPPPQSKASAAGSSLCYTREWWREHKFDERVKVGEDGLFLLEAFAEKVLNRTKNRGLLVYTLKDEPQERVEVSMDKLPKGFRED